MKRLLFYISIFFSLCLRAQGPPNGLSLYFEIDLCQFYNNPDLIYKHIDTITNQDSVEDFHLEIKLGSCTYDSLKIKRILNNINSIIYAKNNFYLDLTTENEVLPDIFKSEYDNLIQARIVSIKSGKCKTLSPSISNLTKIENLNIEGDSLFYLPSEISKLIFLRELNINSPFNKVPDLSLLNNLEYLHLTGRLASLPLTLKYLKKLSHINIYDNERIHSVELNLSSNEDIDLSLSNLPNLDSFILRNNSRKSNELIFKLHNAFNIKFFFIEKHSFAKYSFHFSGIDLQNILKSYKFPNSRVKLFTIDTRSINTVADNNLLKKLKNIKEIKIIEGYPVGSMSNSERIFIRECHYIDSVSFHTNIVSYVGLNPDIRAFFKKNYLETVEGGLIKGFTYVYKPKK